MDLFVVALIPHCLISNGAPVSCTCLFTLMISFSLAPIHRSYVRLFTSSTHNSRSRIWGNSTTSSVLRPSISPLGFFIVNRNMLTPLLIVLDFLILSRSQRPLRPTPRFLLLGRFMGIPLIIDLLLGRFSI